MVEPYTLTEELIALVARATKMDGVDPLNEEAHRALAAGPVEALVVRDPDGAMIGYAQVQDGAAQVVVDPPHRNAGLGTRMVGELLAAGNVLWSFGAQPAALRVAEKLGLHRARELLVMGRSLTDLPAAADGHEADGHGADGHGADVHDAAQAAEPPTSTGPDADGVPAPRPRAVPVPGGASAPGRDALTIRSYTPADQARVLDINARAFSHHPEQGSMDAADFAERCAQPWFDPAGLLIAERDDRVVGFHWTKRRDHTDGEVYVIAVDPDAHGGGIGKALLWAGLRHLADQGLQRVLLWVEGDQRGAVGLYERSGFEVVNRDIVFSGPTGPLEPTPEKPGVVRD